MLYNLKALFTSANGRLESSGQKLRGIKDFHKDRLVLFGKMHDYRPRLFSVVNLGFGELKHHDIFFSIVTNVHNGFIRNLFSAWLQNTIFFGIIIAPWCSIAYEKTRV